MHALNINHSGLLVSVATRVYSSVALVVVAYCFHRGGPSVRADTVKLNKPGPAQVGAISKAQK